MGPMEDNGSCRPLASLVSGDHDQEDGHKDEGQDCTSRTSKRVVSGRSLAGNQIVGSASELEDENKELAANKVDANNKDRLRSLPTQKVEADRRQMLRELQQADQGSLDDCSLCNYLASIKAIASEQDHVRRATGVGISATRPASPKWIATGAGRAGQSSACRCGQRRSGPAADQQRASEVDLRTKKVSSKQRGRGPKTMGARRATESPNEFKRRAAGLHHKLERHRFDCGAANDESEFELELELESPLGPQTPASESDRLDTPQAFLASLHDSDYDQHDDGSSMRLASESELEADPTSRDHLDSGTKTSKLEDGSTKNQVTILGKFSTLSIVRWR